MATDRILLFEDLIAPIPHRNHPGGDPKAYLSGVRAHLKELSTDDRPADGDPLMRARPLKKANWKAVVQLAQQLGYAQLMGGPSG